MHVFFELEHGKEALCTSEEARDQVKHTDTNEKHNARASVLNFAGVQQGGAVRQRAGPRQGALMLTQFLIVIPSELDHARRSCRPAKMADQAPTRDQCLCVLSGMRAGYAGGVRLPLGRAPS